MSDTTTGKATPGPWTLELRNVAIADTGDYDGVCDVRGANGERVVEIWGDDDQCEINARLIAAAPEMLEALKLAQRWLANCTPVIEINGPTPLPVIAAVLAKAAGDAA